MDNSPELPRGSGGRSRLQNIVRAHVDELLSTFEEGHGGRSLPAYVARELRGTVECGDPSFGFCRMAQTAAHLVDRVFPHAPVRQWVLSVPRPLRLALAMEAELCRAVARAHLRAVRASYVRRAKSALNDDLSGPSSGAAQFHVGAVNSTQRFGSSLELNVHFHSLFVDGVHVTEGPFQSPVFVAAEPLDPEEVERVQRDAITRIRRVLVARGPDPSALGLPPPEAHPCNAPDDYRPESPLLDFGEANKDSILPELKGASIQSRVPFGPRAGRPLNRLHDPDLARAFAERGASWHLGSGTRVPAPLVSTFHGFSLHAATLVERDERDRLEKLCRYIMRPAICLKRLSIRRDGQIVWLLKRAWRDGTKGFVMSPLVFLARLAALVPHPREHQLTYHGVLAPASPWRDDVTPAPVLGERQSKSCSNSSTESRWIPWAELLQRVFGEDVLRCPRCRGRRHMISVINDPMVARKMLDSMGQSREPPGSVASREIPMPPRQGRLDFD